VLGAVVISWFRRISEAFTVDDGTLTRGDLVLPRERFYPLRALRDGREPQITSRHAVHNPERPNHRGCDFFYRYVIGDPPMRIGDGGRTSRWWIPPGTFAVAAADGLVEIAGASKTGGRVWLVHAGGLRTGYFHLSELAVKAGQAVSAGDELGVVGDNPVDHDADHLHFEVYRGPVAKYPAGTIDPERWLMGAAILPAI
jgi:hypothetical protein